MNMRLFIRITGMVLILLVGLIGSMSAWSRIIGGGGKGHSLKPEFVEGELIVKYRHGSKHQRHLDSIRRHGGRYLMHLGENTTMHVRLPHGRRVADSLEEYNQDSDVEFAQPNYIYHLMTVPNTTDYAAGNLWGFHNTGQTVTAAVGQFLQPMDAFDSNNNPPPVASTYYDMSMPTAWTIATSCSNIITAVIDSGINYNHTDLSSNLWNGVGGALCPGPNGAGFGGAPTLHGGCDIINGTNTPMDQLGHGTHVAGTIGAAGHAVTMHGHTGVCWTAKLMPLRVFDSIGGGATTAVITRAINYAVANGAKVINMSLGGSAFDQTQYNAVVAAQSQGVLFVVAAGNAASNNDSTPVYPCNYGTLGVTNVLCVAAVDQASQLASFSNFGTGSVTIAGPGTNIMSTWPGLNTMLPSSASDPFNGADVFGNSWTRITAPSGSLGWGFPTVPTSLGNLPALAEPPTFNYSNTYGALADDIAWKDFMNELSPAAANLTTTLNYMAYHQLSSGDSVSLYIDNFGFNPVFFGTYMTSYSGFSGNSFINEQFDVSAYASSDTSIGFETISGASGGSGQGIALFSMNFNQLDNLQTSEYTVIEGTSMATPHVAGLASLLFSYNKTANPNYSYTDVVNALKAGGTALSSLTVKTSSGKAVNAYNSLIYIAQPTSFSAAIQ